jgi:hypothetical protein
VHRRKLAEPERWTDMKVEVTSDILEKIRVDMMMYLPCGADWTQHSLADCRVGAGRLYLNDARSLATCPLVR